jgi:hypothetical protein
MVGPPPDVNHVHLRIVAIITARMLRDSFNEKRWVEEILGDKELLKRHFEASIGLAEDLINALAKESGASCFGWAELSRSSRTSTP